MKEKIALHNFSVYNGRTCLLQNVTLSVYEREILSVIGPAHSGKSTFLRSLNRMIGIKYPVRIKGEIFLDGKNIFDPMYDVHQLRKTVGMISPLPMPLPMSIADNLAYGPRLHGVTDKSSLSAIAEKCLRAASLWEEVSDRLETSAMRLSGGQQQRLCIARTLTVEPQVIVFDEPCSGLDPISTAKVESTMKALIKNYTIILVTNNIKQAQRVSHRTAFFMNNDLIEIGSTSDIFRRAQNQKTRDFISGKFG